DDWAAADAALAACTLELARVGNWWHPADTDPAVPRLFAVPEQLFEVEELPACASAAEAVAHLPATLLTHSDEPLAPPETREPGTQFSPGGYWVRSGLGPPELAYLRDEWWELFSEVRGPAVGDVTPADAITAYLETWEPDVTTTEMLAALQRW